MNASVRPIPVVVLVLGLVAAALVGLGGPARGAAFDGSNTNLGQTGVVGNCFATAGPNYLGLACPRARRSNAEQKFPPYFLCPGMPKDKKPPKDFKKTCQKPPQCWYDPIGKDELLALQKRNEEGPDGITYYWQRNLKGINDNLQETGEVDVDQTLIARGNSDEDYGDGTDGGNAAGCPADKVVDGIPTLTDPQKNLVDYYFDPAPVFGGSTPPDPIGVASPGNGTPRVRTDVSFYDATGGDSTITAEAGNVRLMAVEDSIYVAPRGASSDYRTTPSPCPRQGSFNPNDATFDKAAEVGHEAEEGETKENHPDGCWFTYERSSGDQPGLTYTVGLASHWSVWQSVDGGNTWTPFHSLANPAKPVRFDKRATLDLAVVEVQSINVLPNGDLS